MTTAVVLIAAAGCCVFCWLIDAPYRENRDALIRGNRFDGPVKFSVASDNPWDDPDWPMVTSGCSSVIIVVLIVGAIVMAIRLSS